jgi:hypothetical protein
MLPLRKEPYESQLQIVAPAGSFHPQPARRLANSVTRAGLLMLSPFSSLRWGLAKIRASRPKPKWQSEPGCRAIDFAGL